MRSLYQVIGHTKRLRSEGCCALHQEIPEDKLSRVSAYDWFGSVAMLPLATALAGPAEAAFGRTASLWGCSALILALTLAVLTVPDVRGLRRRETVPVAEGGPAPGPMAEGTESPAVAAKSGPSPGT